MLIKVETPEGDPLRRWSASGAHIAPGEDGALFGFLAGGKHSVVADPDAADDVRLVDELLASADAVVWSAGSRLADLPRFAPAELLAAHPHLIVASITPFGLDGPWSDRAATEFTLQAWSGGIVGLGRGAPDRAPVYVGGRVGDYLSGAYASAAILASRMRVLSGGAGELIDLSMLESHVMGLTYYPVTYFDILGRPWRDARRLTVPGIAHASDGLVDLGCGTAQQWFDLCSMTGHEDWIDEDFAAVDHRAGQREGRRVVCLGRRAHRRRGARPGDGLPHPERPGGQRRHRRVTGALRGPGLVRHQPRRIPPARASLPHLRRRSASAQRGAASGRTHRAPPHRQPSATNRPVPEQTRCR